MVNAVSTAVSAMIVLRYAMMRSSQIAREREEREGTRVRAGDLRRGRVDDRPSDRQIQR